jgi:hypothetical protein
MNNNIHIANAVKYMTIANEERSKHNYFFNRIDKQKVIQNMRNSAESYLLAGDNIKTIEIYLELVKYVLLEFQSLKPSNSDMRYCISDIYHSLISYLTQCNKLKMKIDDSLLELVEKITNDFLFIESYAKIFYQIYHQLAINYELINNLEKAIEIYNQASKYAEYSDLLLEKKKFIHKIAQLSVMSGNNLLAMDKYKECAELSFSKGGIHIHYSYQFIFHYIILKMQYLNYTQFYQELELFSQQFNGFQNSMEFTYAINLFSFYNSHDYQQINDIIIKKVLYLDEPIKLFLKNMIESNQVVNL